MLSAMAATGTWFRCLVKMVRKIPNKPHEDGPEYVPLAGKDYIWFEMGFFTCWDSQDQVRVVCVDTPPDLPSNLQTALEKQAPVEFKDPFSLHRYLIDQMIILYDISVWRVRDPVRIIEKVSFRCPSPLISYLGMFTRFAA
jgi:hypothetical protein